MPEPTRDVERILKRFHQLEERRSTWESHWSEIAQIVWPMADEFITKREPGEKRSQNIYDSTAALALEKFAAAMESMLTPRQQKWHKLRASVEELNEEASVKEWFEAVNRELFAVRNSPRANYYSMKHEGYKSLGAFGNDCLLSEEIPTGGIRYKYCHIGQVYIEVGPDGRVDTIYRLFPMTAKAAKQQWGDRLQAAEKVSKAVEEQPWRQFDFLHVVVPREVVDFDRVDALGMRWESLWISMEDKVILGEGGFHELPYHYSRYTVNPTEMYGRGPAALVLPTIKTLQEEKKVFLRSGHKLVDPPLLVHDDGILGTGSKAVRLKPGGINYGAVTSDGKPLVIPLQTGGRLDLTEGMLQEDRATVQDAFLVLLFQILVEEPQMTATQALIRAQEKGQLLAPTVGRQQAEMLGPQIEREVNILQRQGRLPELPGPLVEAEGEYEIEYDSPATRFQRSEELVGIQRTVEILAPAAQVDPFILLDFLDWQEIARIAADINGVPVSVVRSPDAIIEIRSAREEAQAARELVDGAVQAGKAAESFARAAGPEGVAAGAA